jgi:hypothetical protein
MTLEEWRALGTERQDELCQHLYPGDHWDLFKAIEGEFLREHGKQEGVAEVFCGFASGLGPANAITVRIARGKPRTRLPKKYLGFPALREYEKKPRSGI